MSPGNDHATDSDDRSVVAFEPTSVRPVPAVETAFPVAVATMEKRFDGSIQGRSATLFTAAYSESTGTGTYVAMESFEGSIAGRTGTLNFAHSATTSKAGRTAEFFTIVLGSGTGALTAIVGTGGLAIDADGTHRVWLDYEF
jgi:hypothetical protein